MNFIYYLIFRKTLMVTETKKVNTFSLELLLFGQIQVVVLFV